MIFFIWFQNEMLDSSLFINSKKKSFSLFQYKKMLRKFIFHTDSHQDTHFMELFIRFYDSESASIQQEIFLLINQSASILRSTKPISGEYYSLYNQRFSASV